MVALALSNLSRFPLSSENQLYLELQFCFGNHLMPPGFPDMRHPGHALQGGNACLSAAFSYELVDQPRSLLPPFALSRCPQTIPRGLVLGDEVPPSRSEERTKDAWNGVNATLDGRDTAHLRFSRNYHVDQRGGRLYQP